MSPLVLLIFATMSNARLSFPTVTVMRPPNNFWKLSSFFLRNVRELQILADKTTGSGDNFRALTAQQLAIPEVNDHISKKFHLGLVVAANSANSAVALLQNSAELRPRKYAYATVWLSDAQSTHRDSPQKLLALFQYLWRSLHILRTVVYNQGQAWSYDPFHKLSGEVIKVPITNFISKMEPLWNNLRGNSLRVNMLVRHPLATFKNVGKERKYAGLDGSFYEIVMEKMNYSAEMIPPSDGLSYSIKTENGSATGPLRDISNTVVEVGFNSMVSSTLEDIEVEFIIPAIYFANILIIVPKAGVIPSWKVITKLFSWKLWVTILSFYFLSAVFLHTLLLVRGRQPRHSGIVGSFTEILHYFVTNPFSKMYKHERASTQSFVTACLLLGVILVTLFQAGLVDILTNPRYHPDINSAEDLIKSGLLVATDFEEFVALLKKTQSRYSKIISNRCIHKSAISAVLWSLLYRNISTLTDSLGESIFQGVVPGAESFLHTIPESFGQYFAIHVSAKGSPLLERFKDVHFQVMETGLGDVWLKDVVKAIHSRGKAAYTHLVQDITVERTFGLQDVSLAFFILILGLGAATMTYVVEVFWKKVGTLFLKDREFGIIHKHNIPKRLFHRDGEFNSNFFTVQDLR